MTESKASDEKPFILSKIIPVPSFLPFIHS